MIENFTLRLPFTTLPRCQCAGINSDEFLLGDAERSPAVEETLRYRVSTQKRIEAVELDHSGNGIDPRRAVPELPPRRQSPYALLL